MRALLVRELPVPATAPRSSPAGPRRGEIIRGAVLRRTRFAAFDHTRLADMLLSRLT